MQASAQFLSLWLDLIIDAGLICAFFFLWLSWYRNGKRQKRLEQMLAATAAQLQEATRHLSTATDAIKHLKHQKPGNARAKPAKPARPQRTAPISAGIPAQNSTQATMILRMKREGESPQTIAERLDMPLAQVKLLLKLHITSGAMD